MLNLKIQYLEIPEMRTPFPEKIWNVPAAPLKYMIYGSGGGGRG